MNVQLKVPDAAPNAALPTWVIVMIQSGLSILAAYIQTTKLSPAKKAAAEKLIADGEAFAAIP